MAICKDELKYSKKSFKGYTRRGKVEITTTDGHTHQMDIYTNQTNKDYAVEFLRSHASEKVVKLDIVYWTTKEADDATAKLLDETLGL